MPRERFRDYKYQAILGTEGVNRLDCQMIFPTDNMSSNIEHQGQQTNFIKQTKVQKQTQTKKENKN